MVLPHRHVVSACELASNVLSLLLVATVDTFEERGQIQKVLIAHTAKTLGGVYICHLLLPLLDDLSCPKISDPLLRFVTSGSPSLLLNSSSESDLSSVCCDINRFKQLSWFLT